MVIKMVNYFSNDLFGKMELEAPLAWLWYGKFMSDGILTVGEYDRDYFQSPVDDFFSYYYTMQRASFFHDQEFAANGIPFVLKILREDFLGTQTDRCFAASNIATTSSITSLNIVQSLPAGAPSLVF